MLKNKNDYSFPIAELSLSFTSNANAFKSSRPVIFSISTGSTAETVTPAVVLFLYTTTLQGKRGVSEFPKSGSFSQIAC